MYSYINNYENILPHSIYSGPVLHHAFFGNSDTIKSCVFNPVK